jgi:hypothetical protein
VTRKAPSGPETASATCGIGGIPRTVQYPRPARARTRPLRNWNPPLRSVTCGICGIRRPGPGRARVPGRPRDSVTVSPGSRDRPGPERESARSGRGPAGKSRFCPCWPARAADLRLGKLVHLQAVCIMTRISWSALADSARGGAAAAAARSDLRCPSMPLYEYPRLGAGPARRRRGRDEG